MGAFEPVVTLQFPVLGVDDDSKLPPILPPAQHARYVGTSTNWRAPELPGLDAPAPPGAAPVKVDKRTLSRYVKIRKTFDRPKAVEQFRPYAEIAVEAREGMLQEMAESGPVGVRVSFVIDAAVRQDMYSRYVGDRAVDASQSTDEGAVQTVATLAKVAAASASAAVKSVIAASKMHSEVVAAAAKDRRVDPLAAFVEPKIDR